MLVRVVFLFLFVWSSIAVPADEAQDSNASDNDNPLTNILKNLDDQLREILTAMSKNLDNTLGGLTGLMRAPVTCVQRTIEEHGSEIVGPSVLLAAQIGEILGEYQPSDITDIISRALDALRAVGENDGVRNQITSISNGIQKMIDVTNQCVMDNVKAIIGPPPEPKDKRETPPLESSRYAKYHHYWSHFNNNNQGKNHAETF